MIYCVEDDENIRELVVYTLKTADFKARGYADGKAFTAALDEELPELVMLDIMLPGEDGLSLLARLKSSERTKQIPVIMMTAKDTEYDKVRGLDAGADDYIAKPFGMMEMISRVKAVLRRSTGPAAGGKEKDKIRIGKLTMNLHKHEVKAGDKVLPLTLKEYELLHRLMTNPNRVLTRDQLLEDIWGYDFNGETRTVDVHIRTLRQKLGKQADLIETVRGVGYRISE